MSNLIAMSENDLKKRITGAVKSAAEKGYFPDVDIPDFNVEIPAERSHGDYASNVAMSCARSFKMPPRKIAEIIVDNLDISGSFFERVEIAGAGFINLFFGENFYVSVLKDIRDSAERYGRSDYGEGKRVCLEFVSANPTGPMHLGNARGAALGDCLASLMEAAGFNVTKEFYINDAGNQIEKLADSLEVRYLQIFNGEDSVKMPEDAYHGEDIKHRAAQFADEFSDKYVGLDSEIRKKALVEFTLPKNVEQMKAQLSDYNVEYDVWFSEKSLHDNGEVKDVIRLMSEKGLTYEKDGALWYRSKQAGQEKDEVLVRSNGIPSYFAADIAYHRNKFINREFDVAIDIWGADHHGHVARLKGAMDDIGIDSSRLHIILMQLVRLVRDGQAVRMSKRTGKAITLADLLEEIPLDAARFFFNMREPNSQMEFDLDLAVEQSSKNPVYYVQYAHARISGILDNLAKDNIDIAQSSEEELRLLSAPEEKELILHLAGLTDEIISSVKSYNPSQITRYAVTLANLFHKFYNSRRVKNDDDALTRARAQLCVAVRDTLKNILNMLKVSAPENM